MKHLEEILMAEILYNHEYAKEAKKWPTHSKMQLCRENLRARAALYNIKYYTAQLNMTDCMCPWYWP